MSEAVVDDIVAVLPPLLQTLEALSFVARHLHPPDFDRVMQAAGTPDQALQSVRERLADWPEEFSAIGTALEAASDAALAAFGGLRMVHDGHGDIVAVFKALRYAPRAQEALYPLVAKLPPVSQFFIEPALREDTALLERLAAPAHDNTGIIHNNNEPGSRGGFSLYVPEYYTPDRTWPLVMVRGARRASPASSTASSASGGENASKHLPLDVEWAGIRRPSRASSSWTSRAPRSSSGRRAR